MSNTTDTTADLDSTANLTPTADLTLAPKTKAQLKAEKANADTDKTTNEEERYPDKEVLEVIRDRVPESNPFKYKIIKTINELLTML